MSTYYNGTNEMIDRDSSVVSGEFAVLARNETEISLPSCPSVSGINGSVIEVLLHGSRKATALIEDHKEYHKDTTIRCRGAPRKDR